MSLLIPEKYCRSNKLVNSHGIIASNNNSGVTLESTDGRNMAVWFDGSVQGLSASFGLDQGEAVAQTSTVSLTQASAGQHYQAALLLL